MDGRAFQIGAAAGELENDISENIGTLPRTLWDSANGLRQPKTALAALSPFLLLGMAGLGALYKMERDKRRDIELRLNENKSKIYADFIRTYSSLFFKENGRDKTANDLEKIALDIQAFARQALLYASDDVITKFHSMYRIQLNQTPGEDAMVTVRRNVRAFAAVVKAIRKELGHSRTKINNDLIGGLLITDYKPD